MGAELIVEPPEVLNDDGSLLAVLKPFLVEAFVSDPPVETLVDRVVPGLRWRDVCRLDAGVDKPLLNCEGDKLGPVVRPQEGRNASLPDQPFQGFDDPLRSDASRNLDSETLSRPLINDGQAFEAVSIHVGIEDKIVGPDLIAAGDLERPRVSASTAPTTNAAIAAKALT